MKKYFSLLFLTVFFSYFSVAQISEQQNPKHFLDRNENFVEIKLSDNDITSQMETLDKLVYIDSFNSTENTVKAYVTKKQLEDFLESDYSFTVLTPPSMLLSKARLDNRSDKSVNDWDYYPSYSEYVDMMNQFVTCEHS